jgi:short-subunit dehydrogenase
MAARLPDDLASDRPLAVVTGASSGIGLELARRFAEHGFDRVVVAEDAAIDAVPQQLGATGAQVTTVRADLASREGVHALLDQVRAAGRPVEAIAINAGVGVGGAFADTEFEDELNLIQLNVVSTVHLAKHVVRDMQARGRGRILFTSSIAAEMPAPFQAVYGASKAFIQSFSEALRNELKDSGVSVTALQPGPTETNFFHRADMDDTRVATSKKDDAAEVARQGFEALMAGKDHVVAGSVMNKVQSALAQVTPEPLAAAMHRKLTEPGSGTPDAR